MIEYTPEITDRILNLYFRKVNRVMAPEAIAKELGLPNHTGIDDLLWKLFTGYGNPVDPGDPKGLRYRRNYTPVRGVDRQPIREDRTGWPWWQHEVDALRHMLGGKGQTCCTPKCNVAYAANILARPQAEVRAKWEEINNPTGAGNFGLTPETEATNEPPAPD